MLLALRIKNFKSIREARVQFGPFTCFMGHNGVGKSNLFDAIHFLGQLAEREISEAAADVRKSSGGAYSPLDLIFGRDHHRRMELSADMIVPSVVEDDFGQSTKPSTTLLTYTLGLDYSPESDQLVVASERLAHAKLGDYTKFVGFNSSANFRQSVVAGSRRGGPLISTEEDRIMLHGDGGSRSRPAPVGRSPLTVVGGTNTFDYPTVLAAKREMSSWRVLHLEPSAMRTPDPRSARPPHVSADGGRIPVTLHSLISANADSKAEIVNRLRQLNSDIKDIDVATDDLRDQLALQAKISGTENWVYGRSLSDGTLRYVALVLMLIDVRDRAMLCIEEPENGIHPSRIPHLVNLLRDYAVDIDEPVAPDNPPRQVTINTHSPEVVRQFAFGDMIFVERALTRDGPVSVFRPIKQTWRDNLSAGDPFYSEPASRGAVVNFIGGSPISEDLRGEQLDFEFGSAT